MLRCFDGSLHHRETHGTSMQRRTTPSRTERASLMIWVGSSGLSHPHPQCHVRRSRPCAEPLQVNLQGLQDWTRQVPRWLAVRYLTVMVPTIPADSCGVQKYL